VNQPDVPLHLLSQGAKASRTKKIRLKIKEFASSGLPVVGAALVLVMKYHGA
jgi:hypothetical protein